MRAVCAWCGTTLVEGDPGDRGVSHGICPACSRAWSAGLARCVVLPSHRSFLLPDIQQAFREIRDLRVIVDRRRGSAAASGSWCPASAARAAGIAGSSPA
jgi:hypothetical protein